MNHRLAGMLVLAVATLAPAQSAPHLLADLETRPAQAPVLSSSPSEFVRAGAWTFFAADDPVLGRELFRTNGTSAGTGLFADLNPGPASSSPRLLTAASSRLYFLYDDWVSGAQPWVSDGTVTGTRRIPGFGAGPRVFSRGAAFGSKWALLAEFGFDQTLWVTDGTAEGTVAILEPADLEEGERISLIQPVVLDAGGASPELVFSSEVQWGPSFVWRSDGTRAGTRRVPMPVRAGAWPCAVVNGRVIVGGNHVASPLIRRSYLSIWDGSNAPQVALTLPDFFWYSSATATVFDGRAWIIGSSPATFLLVTDGTPGGTRAIASTRYGSSIQATAALGVVGGSLWLAAGAQIFRVDPGMADPVPIGALPFAIRSLHVGPSIGSRVLFVLDDLQMRALELQSLAWTNLGVIGPRALLIGAGLGRGYFAHSDPRYGIEPWLSDGTPGGTMLLADLARSPLLTADSNPGRFMAFGDRTAFLAGDGQNVGSSLWLSDGSAAGTRAIATGLSESGFAVASGGRLFVRTTDPVLGDAVLVSDGTPTGTRRVALPPAVLAEAEPIVLGDEIVVAGRKNGRPALFASDGRSMRFFREFPLALEITLRFRIGESLVLTSAGGFGTNELWTTDGSAAGTQSIITLYSILAVARWQDRVWFLARPDAATDRIELWFSDGTTVGTGPFARLPVLRMDPQLLAARDHLFVLSADALLAFHPGSTVPELTALSPYPAELTQPRFVGDRLVFEGFDWTSRRGVLWSSDGSAAGTLRITQPFRRKEPALLNPAKLTSIGSRHALFPVADAASVVQTWITDGTAAGTRLFSDRVLVDRDEPGIESGSHAANGIAIVGMVDPVYGIEPHVIELDWSVEPQPRGCGGARREAELFASLGPAPSGGLAIELRSSAGTWATVLMSAPPQRPTPIPSAGRCNLDVDANAYVVLLSAPLSGGRLVQGWTLPPDPALRGLQATLQAACAPTDAPLGFDLSNGLLVNLWR